MSPLGSTSLWSSFPVVASTLVANDCCEDIVHNHTGGPLCTSLTRMGSANPDDISPHMTTLELPTHRARCIWPGELPKAPLSVPMAGGRPCLLPRRSDAREKPERGGEEDDEADMWAQLGYNQVD
jgi:hypothetical protein